MREQDVITAIKVAVPSRVQPQGAEAMARVHMLRAILKIGRTPDVDWNKTEVKFTLTPGTSRYEIGSGILSKYADMRNLAMLWRIDEQGKPITIIAKEEFNRRARGSTTTGEPTVACLHSDDKVLEFWPEPDSAYTLWGYIQKAVTKLTEIPDQYHDVVIDEAIASMQLENADRRAHEGRKEMRDDSMTKWNGTTISISRHLGRRSKSSGAWSQNLTGE